MQLRQTQTGKEVFAMDNERKQGFRDAMAQLAAAVTVVTTDGSGGRAGFAATAVCSASDTPPTLLVCLNRSSSAYSAMSANGVACVNILKGHQKHLSQLFGGKTPVEERFAGGLWTTMQTGAPALTDALISLDCKVSSVVESGTHDILICNVVGIRDGEGPALIYFNRAYHEVQR